MTTLTSGVNAIAATVQTALTNNYLRKTSGNILNADINAGAAIAYSKLNLGTSIVNADVNAAAAIAYSKLNLASSIVTGDIVNGTILNADISASAAVTQNKLAATPYCLAYRGNASGTQAFGSATGTVSFSAAQQTDGTMWTAGNPTRIFAPYTGYYTIVTDCNVTGAAMAGNDIFRVIKNAVTVLGNTAFYSSTANNSKGEFGVFLLSASEFIELQWFRTAATGVTTVIANGTNMLNPLTEPSHFGAMRLQFLGS